MSRGSEHRGDANTDLGAEAATAAPGRRPRVTASSQRQVEARPPTEREGGPPLDDGLPGLLVDDGPVGPGQLLFSTFLDTLREAVSEVADRELGPEFSAVGCPYIDQYFRRYSQLPAAATEALLRRYAPGVRDVRDARAMIPIVTARVAEGVRAWRTTGQPPTELQAAEPRLAEVGAAPPGAAGAPPGSAAATVAQMGPGQPLPGPIASQMSTVVGRDLSGVEVHTAPEAAAVAGEHQARALAVGSHVAFAPGEYAPGTLAGDALLAHELTHTAQQGDPTLAEQHRPLEGERATDEVEADEVARATALAHATGVAPRRSWLSTLRSGLSLQRCNVAARPPQDFAALSLKDKAAWVDATVQAGKDGRGRVIVDALRQLSAAEFVALQRQTDFTAVVATLSDWDAVELGALGPVTGDAATKLNAKRAGHVVHAMKEYSGGQAELHVAYVLSTMYDDDVHDLAMEVANRNRLSKMLGFGLVRDNLRSRGISLDAYQDAGDGRSGPGRFFGGMAEKLWDLGTQNKDDDHYFKSLPGVFGQASQALDIEATLPTSVGGALHLMDNALTFGMVGGAIGLATNTASGVGHLIEGDYEAAGADLTDAALVVTIHLGVKALATTKPAPGAGSPPGSAPGGPGLLGPAGPGQFVIAGFEGPLSAAEAKVGAAVTRGLTIEAQAAIGRILGRIGRGGVERVAGYMRNREAAAFVAERGEAAVYALAEAQGDVAVARTKLPDRQLGVGTPDSPSHPGATSRLSPAVVEVLTEVGVDVKRAEVIAARGIAGDAIAEIAIDHGTAGIQVLDGLTKSGLDAKATSKVLALGKSTGTMTDLVDLTKDGLLENPRGLGKFLDRMALELQEGAPGLRNELGFAAARARSGHRVSLGGRKLAHDDPESGQADVVDYSDREASQMKTITSAKAEAVAVHVEKAHGQLMGVWGEHPPAGYQKTIVIKIANPKNSLYGLPRSALLQQLRTVLADLRLSPDLILEIDNGAAGTPYRYSGQEVSQ